MEILDYYEDLRAAYFIQGGGNGLLAYHHASVIRWILELKDPSVDMLQQAFDEWQAQGMSPEMRASIARVREMIREGTRQV